MVRLTERDRKIFQFIYENGYVTAPHIHLQFFPKGSLWAAHVRLGPLVREGYLKKVRWGTVIYKLTSKALYELPLSENQIKQYQRKKIAINQLSHDLKIVDFRQIFEKSPLVGDWIPAHRLMSQDYADFQFKDRKYTKVPDAIFSITLRDKIIKVAFEFERTRKSKSYYISTFENYHLIYPVGLIIYVAANDDLKTLLLDMGKQALNKLAQNKVDIENKLHVATYEEFKKYKLSTLFQSPLNNKFSIEELQMRYTSP